MTKLIAVASTHLARTASLITIVISVTVLIGGWILGIPVFQSIVPEMPKMVANTAIAFVLLGASLYLLRTHPAERRKRLVGQACALAATLIGILTLAEYIFGWNLGIDQFLVRDLAGELETSIPGRPSPQTSVSFVLAGLALLLLDFKSTRNYRPSQYLALGAALIALLALLGYIYGVAPLYSVSSYTGMSIPTAILFAIVSIGILFSRPHEGFVAVALSESAGGIMARRLLPATFVIPCVIGWVIVMGLQSSLYELNFAFSVFVLLNVVVFASIIFWNAALLNRLELERQQASDEIRRLNLDLNRRAVALEASNKELEAFSYSVSHDLRAPLRAIDGFSHMLMDHHADALNAEGQRLLQRLRDASQRMKYLIDDLLELSRLTRTEMKNAPVNLSDLVSAIATSLRDTYPDRTVEFAIQEGVATHGDSRLLRIALENLINNAWKFTRKQPNARIEFGVMSENGKQAFFVRDNGVGFDMTYSNKLFGAFQRLHSDKEFEGTGIGLATVQRVILRHGGEIWADSVVDEGTTFYFTL